MTDEQLKGIAAQVLNMAKRDVEQGCWNWLLASYNEGDVPPLRRMRKIERFIVERLGEDWLDDGARKDAGFHALRLAVRYMPPDALAIVTSVNRFELTAKFHALPEARKEQVVRAGNEHYARLVAEGLLEAHDSLFALVQTPSRVCLSSQDVSVSDGEFVGTPQTQCGPLEGFEGRLRMFGGDA